MDYNLFETWTIRLEEGGRETRGAAMSVATEPFDHELAMDYVPDSGNSQFSNVSAQTRGYLDRSGYGRFDVDKAIASNYLPSM